MYAEMARIIAAPTQVRPKGSIQFNSIQKKLYSIFSIYSVITGSSLQYYNPIWLYNINNHTVYGYMTPK
jgi:hypothetical protein